MSGPHVIQVELPLERIEVRERSRLSVGDIGSLAESIRRRGLLHPPVVRRDYDGDGWVLVAGQRRLEALRLLGHDRTLVTVAHSAVDELAALQAEGEENTERQPFTPEEAVRHRKRIEAVVAAQAKERQREHGGTAPGQNTSSKLDEVSPAHERTTRHVTAKGTGYGATTLDKAEKVVEAAEDDELPEPVREVAAEAVREMNETGKVDPAHRKVEEAKREWRPNKPDLGDGISHPARYSAELTDLFRTLLAEYGLPADRILDPFAGTGRIHELQDDGWETVGIEIEPEWASLHPDTRVGDAQDLPFDDETFGAVVTSPTYGNRLADSHNAADPERRRSYTHDLGRPLSDASSGDIHWRTTAPGTEQQGSAEYRAFHERAWVEAVRVLQPGGLFILNCCDHIREGLVQPVTAWHCWALGRLGLDYVESRSVPTRKLRQGANGDLREQEQVHVFRKPA